MSSSVSLRFRASAKAAVTRSAAGCGSAVPFSAASTQENVSVPSPTAIRHVPARSHRSGSSSAAARKCPVHAHGERRGFVRVYLDREALRRERQVSQQKICKVTFAQRGDE